jgi:hypothetical protein
VIRPPSGGPITGAVKAGQVRKAMARIRSCFSVLRSTMRRPTGTIIAPPMPWTMRAAVNARRLPLAAQRIEAMVKVAIAEPNTTRAPNRSVTQPLAGMKTATVSR